jgi:hypothetical protein
MLMIPQRVVDAPLRNLKLRVDEEYWDEAIYELNVIQLNKFLTFSSDY